MTFKLKLLLVALSLSVAACDGPRENAGEKADVAAGTVDGEDTFRSGPAEEMGARQDAAADAMADAKEAEADSLEAAAAETRQAARQRANALRKEAQVVRDAPAAAAAPEPMVDVNGM
ncbi:MAG: hypothetical protein M3Q15_06815 [Pseudomonadota bacterium]|nr:hypothetical protein [Pseudomonadota bacterium]